MIAGIDDPTSKSANSAASASVTSSWSKLSSSDGSTEVGGIEEPVASASTSGRSLSAACSGSRGWPKLAATVLS